MTAPYADLIERLLARVHAYCNLGIVKQNRTELRNPDGPEAAKAIEALQAEVERLSAAPPASVGREEIARIVSPEAFEPLPHGNIVRGREAVALAKADAILSALGRTEALTPPEGDGLTLGG